MIHRSSSLPGIYRAVKPLVLASASPRRLELLSSLGIDFAVRPSEMNEPAHQPGQSPQDYAREMARLKTLDVARTVWPENAGAVVLGADTIVVQGDDVLGKPADQAQALDMLTRLCGAEHKVVTGCCLAAQGSQETLFHAETRVRMRASTRDELAAYVATGEPADKAGAYAIQGLAACLVEWVEGSYTNVVGLPLARVLEVLQRWEVVVPQRSI